MAKPWARLEIGYLSHPKFLALTANAICLWHEAKNYCDAHHTDGLIPRDALKMFRFRGRKSVEMLLKSCGEKPDESSYAPLWEEHLVGYKMHDYLDHNDCRDEVLARLDDANDQAELRKHANKERQARYRAERKAKLAAFGVTPRVTPVTVTEQRDSHSDSHSDVTRTCSTPTETETLSVTNKKKRSAPPAGDAAPSHHPIKAFLSTYEELFQALAGDKPVLVNGRDAKIAKTTIEKVGQEKAHALLRSFFASSDQFIQKSGYGLNIFAGQLNKLIVGDGQRQALRDELAADSRGHVPPCHTNTECNRKFEAEIEARKAAVAS